VRKRLLFTALLFIFIMSGEVTPFAQSGDVPKMTTQALSAVMGRPDVIVIDVRLGRDWTDSDSKIKGAVREDPEAIQSWANKYPKDKTLVFYCA
jgi:Rhodanese-like domain